ncbi:PREDICTED: E3 ubiquitin-protein ligase FANCL isoform X2 [Dinoponera quadriceps]|uniref:E3 ubiquitin-protein ligase FANCL isoform X2 n=1 Tax=Dinoponera quadriceps TaxID=609295 RepID=A0A6P3Y0J8_DINQU|nr:PREDICTED: E3 ubiquitin-protein ligase FANCL isoform X2 [Dinoponera quadriceps]
MAVPLATTSFGSRSYPLIMSEKRNDSNGKNVISDYRLSAWHPEMILVSKAPVTLQGFLIIPNSPSATLGCIQTRIKLQLIAPNYPSVRDAQINFGTAIALLRDRKFDKKMKELMSCDVMVPSFLTRLQSLIVSTSNFMEDLQSVLPNPSGVQLSCDDRLKNIKLSLNDISVILERNENTEVPWKIISSDFPKILAFEGFEKNIKNLSIAITKFKWQVELLEKAWEQLRQIDKNCWVIDPPEPNKSHMHRRIHLSQSISVIITIDPLKPTALPEIKFIGSDSEVKKQEEYASNNIGNWNLNCSLLENLRMLLNMYEFPEPQESLEDKNSIIGSRECGICFFAKMEETAVLPDKICNNKKCMIHYHSACLAKWLQTKAGNQVVFGHIHGTCPHCKENISCSIEY